MNKMRDLPPTSPRLWVRVAVTVVYLLSIYLSLPFVRDVVTALSERQLLSLAVLLLYGLGAAFGVYLFVFYFKIRGGMAYLFTAIVTAIFVIALRQLEVPEERVHFLQYGFFGLLVSYSLELREGNFLKLMLWAAALSFAAGAMDEVIQHFLPNRYFEWRDIGLNAFGAVLGLGYYVIVRRYRTTRQ